MLRVIERMPRGIAATFRDNGASSRAFKWMPRGIGSMSRGFLPISRAFARMPRGIGPSSREIGTMHRELAPKSQRIVATFRDVATIPRHVAAVSQGNEPAHRIPGTERRAFRARSRGVASASWSITGSSRDTDPVSRVTEVMSRDETASLPSVAAELRGKGSAHRCTAVIFQGVDPMQRPSRESGAYEQPWPNS